MAKVNIESLANMSDEDFLKTDFELEPEEQEEESQNTKDEKEEETPSEPGDSDEDEDVSSSGSDEEADDSADDEKEEPVEENPSENEPASQSENTPKEEKKEPAAVNPLENAEQYEQFYKTVMSPIKANGKTIQLRSPNDVISLIQQGANYTQKMQAIAPYRKHLKLLEDNELLDEEKLRFLIDVSKGDKDALKKLLSDNKIDTSDLSYDDFDEDGNPKPVQYIPKTRMVNDQEVAWSDAWKELLAQEQIDNVDTHSVIMKMDAQSQKQVYENPQILNLMHVTQACGAYDKIVSEMDRLRTLGYIANNAPFLQTFIDVKNLMLQQGMLDEESKKAMQLTNPQSIPPMPMPAPKKQSQSRVNNNARARAAAPSRSSGKSTKLTLNPLTMSDEEFMKHYDEF